GHEESPVLKDDQSDKAENDDPEGDFHLFHCFPLSGLLSTGDGFGLRASRQDHDFGRAPPSRQP
ncbi:MAG TPA: hypothetical protein VLT88_08365, partial [Desulfosarcina sp.]|nr:hypothetical protein [Desulfosarcina sp.]